MERLLVMIATNDKWIGCLGNFLKLLVHILQGICSDLTQHHQTHANAWEEFILSPEIICLLINWLCCISCAQKEGLNEILIIYLIKTCLWWMKGKTFVYSDFFFACSFSTSAIFLTLNRWWIMIFSYLFVESRSQQCYSYCNEFCWMI